MKKITTNIGIRYFLGDAIFFHDSIPPASWSEKSKFFKVLCDFHEKKLPSIYVLLFSFGYRTQLGALSKRECTSYRLSGS